MSKKKYVITKEGRPEQYWLPAGRGYTDQVSDAGQFTLEDLVHHDFNLSGCTLTSYDAATQEWEARQKKPNYSVNAKECTVTLNLSCDEVAAITEVCEGNMSGASTQAITTILFLVRKMGAKVRPLPRRL